MQNAQPEAQDYQFEYEGVKYAIGYDKENDVLALSSNAGGDWAWEQIIQYVEQTLKAEGKSYYKNGDEIMTEFVGVVNKHFEKLGSTEPVVDKHSIEYIIHAVQNRLKFSGGVLLYL